MKRAAARVGTAAMRMAAALLFASSASRVHAHAGPQVRGILFGQGELPELLVSNRGLIVGSQEHADWYLMCNEALGVGTSERLEVVRTPDGRVLVATSKGLSQTTDSGCSWTGVAPYEKVNAPSLAQDPTQPNRLYLTTYAPGQSALRVSADGGETWQTLMAAADSEYLRYIRIAPGDPQRLYVRSLGFGDKSFTFTTWRSSDGGTNWQSSPIALMKSETDFVLLSVSPIDPDLLVAMAVAESPALTPERLFVSHDAGKTFENPTSLNVINTAAFSADGKTLWIGSDDGLFASIDAGKTFSKVGTAEYIDSLYELDGKLLVGGFWRGASSGMPGVGVSLDDGETLQQWMGLTQVTHPLVCDPSSKTATVCAPLWIDWQGEILGIYPGDATAGSGGSGAAAGSGAGASALSGRGGSAATSGSASKRSGCAVLLGPGARASSDPWAGAWLVLFGWLRCRSALRKRKRWSRRDCGVSSDP